jgi:TonB family protein
VKIGCVVLPDGTVGDVRVTKALHPDLDAQAVSAVKQWLFTPGTKDGEAVAVQVAVEVTFTIRGNREDPAVPAVPAVTEPVIYRVGSGVTPPVAVSRVQAQYTERARHERIQGTVAMKCVILADGTLGDVRVVSPLDSELDQEAIKAVRQWTFKPGLKDGTPVNVEVDIEMSFSVR